MTATTSPGAGDAITRERPLTRSLQERVAALDLGATRRRLDGFDLAERLVRKSSMPTLKLPSAVMRTQLCWGSRKIPRRRPRFEHRERAAAARGAAAWRRRNAITIASIPNEDAES